jgi:hypothetical protein
MNEGGFGWDMIRGTVTDFRLNSDLGWSKKGGAIVGQDDEPWGLCMDGRSLKGPGYFVNSGKQWDTRGVFELTPRGLTIQYNPSTMKHPWHLTTDVESMANAIMEDAGRVGLDFDLDSARLGRVDLTRQAVMDSPCRAFIPAFTAMRGKRSRDTRYPDGYSFGNKSWKTVFYDKTRQATKVKGVQGMPANVVRCEMRVMQSKNIGHTVRGLGIGTFKDVRDMHPEAVKDAYTRSVESKVFRMGESTQLVLDFNTEVELLTQLRTEHERGAVDRYIAMEGIESILRRFGDMTLFGDALRQAGWSERQARRHLNRFKDMMYAKAFIDQRRQTATIATRIQELRNTFIA